MSTTITIKPGELGKAMRAEARKVSTATQRAAIGAARRFAGHLRERADELGITDRGLYKNGWRANPTKDGAIVFNDSPHAGVIELGARPHAVSPAGRQSIKDWAKRKLGLDDSEAERASWAIANKLREEGQEGRYVVRDALPMATAFYRDEVERLLRKKAS